MPLCVGGDRYIGALRTTRSPSPPRAGADSRRHTAELEELGIIWDTADAAFAENLAAARAYFEAHGTLAAPRHGVALGKPVGQWLTNVRRPGGLGKDPVRARRRAEALAAIDEDWNPGARGWTVDWQRHYAYLAQLLDEGARLSAVVPGVTRHGEDIGRWLATQRREFDQLGVKAVRARRATAKAAAPTPSGRGAAAFQTGIQALAQYQEREGSGLPGRGHVELLPDGMEHRTGVWIVNQKQRRGRLTPDQLAQLAELGVDWAR
ncbi:helicase associated domain-containing protein [Streptomyces sp. NPDC029003]|uniref:helicase associated domain-containing protein n=1 Tax=Streptomyces sp. NPDC029003 TaxID=3155125 RepID=UPI0033FC13BC